MAVRDPTRREASRAGPRGFTLIELPFDRLRVVRQRERAAFTLIELLVVISIIALLVSILLPSIKRAKELAYIITCENNHKAFMQATGFYATENDDFMPFPNWATKYSNAGWAYDLNQIGHGRGANSIPEDQRQESVRTGQLWPYVEDLRAYRCPEDPGPWPDNQPSRWICSYSMNGALCGYGHYEDPGQDLLLTYRSADFSGDDIILWEVDETKAGGYWNDCANHPGEGVTKRHRSGATVGMVCGATQWMTYEEYYAEADRHPGRLWCNPGREDGG